MQWTWLNGSFLNCNRWIAVVLVLVEGMQQMAEVAVVIDIGNQSVIDGAIFNSVYIIDEC